MYACNACNACNVCNVCNVCDVCSVCNAWYGMVVYVCNEAYVCMSVGTYVFIYVSMHACKYVCDVMQCNVNVM